MNKLAKALIFAAATTSLATVANAQATPSATAGSNPYAGPTPTYDFDGSTPTIDPAACCVVTGTTPNVYAQPYGSTGNYFSSGPSTSEPATILFGAWAGSISSLSFIWGSIDSYNSLVFTDAAGNPLGAGYTFTGSDIALLIPALANGDQSDPNTNPLVTFNFVDPTVVGGMQLTSNGTNAFEIDNIAINPVPEPATWAMMLFGFGAMGVAMRRRKTLSGKLAQIA
jgi:hypothetical protein